MPEQNYILIETHQDLAHYCQKIKEGSDWVGFDTEFIGEKRYIPLLCLVQISSEIGNFLIDTLAFDNVDPLCDLFEDETILKITHAGENDYQLFYRLFNILPKNVVDVQISVGFLGDGYPCSFQKIVQKYAKVKISKSQTVTDWKTRPIREKQIRYALNDVIFLKEIWAKLKHKLERQNRLSWALEECKKFEKKSHFEQDLLSDILENKLMNSLREKDQLFYIRLSLWREEEASRNNLSREKVLSSKSIPVIVKMMHSGKQSLLSDRRIGDHIVKKYWDRFNALYQKSATDQEKEWLSRIVSSPVISEEHNILMDLLNQVFKLICTQNKVAGILLMPRSDFNKMKFDTSFTPEYLKTGWRKEILGEPTIKWLENRKDLSVRFEEGEIRIGLKK